MAARGTGQCPLCFSRCPVKTQAPKNAAGNSLRRFWDETVDQAAADVPAPAAGTTFWQKLARNSAT